MKVSREEARAIVAARLKELASEKKNVTAGPPRPPVTSAERTEAIAAAALELAARRALQP